MGWIFLVWKKRLSPLFCEADVCKLFGEKACLHQKRIGWPNLIQLWQTPSHQANFNIVCTETSSHCQNKDFQHLLQEALFAGDCAFMAHWESEIHLLGVWSILHSYKMIWLYNQSRQDWSAFLNNESTCIHHQHTLHQLSTWIALSLQMTIPF